MPWILEWITHALTGEIVEAKAGLSPPQRTTQRNDEKKGSASPAINKDILPGTALTRKRNRRLKLAKLKLKIAEQKAMKVIWRTLQNPYLQKNMSALGKPSRKKTRSLSSAALS